MNYAHIRTESVGWATSITIQRQFLLQPPTELHPFETIREAI